MLSRLPNLSRVTRRDGRAEPSPNGGERAPSGPCRLFGLGIDAGIPVGAHHRTVGDRCLLGQFGFPVLSGPSIDATSITTGFPAATGSAGLVLPVRLDVTTPSAGSADCRARSRLDALPDGEVGLVCVAPGRRQRPVRRRRDVAILGGVCAWMIATSGWTTDRGGFAGSGCGDLPGEVRSQHRHNQYGGDNQVPPKRPVTPAALWENDCQVTSSRRTAAAHQRNPCDDLSSRCPLQARPPAKSEVTSSSSVTPPPEASAKQPMTKA